MRIHANYHKRQNEMKKKMRRGLKQPHVRQEKLIPTRKKISHHKIQVNNGENEKEFIKNNNNNNHTHTYIYMDFLSVFRHNHSLDYRK